MGSTASSAPPSPPTTVSGPCLAGTAAGAAVAATGAGAGAGAAAALPSHTYPRRPGCTYEPLVDGLAAFSAICGAVDSAKSSVQVIVSFCNLKAAMPGGRTFLDVIAAACQRGVTVRLLVWHSTGFSATLHPTAEVKAALAAACPASNPIIVRWDGSPDRHHSHHQKAWLVDADAAGADCTPTAFVGGINIMSDPLHRPAHDDARRQRHDLYSRVTGPAVADVLHTFVQRWNGAGTTHCTPSPAAAHNLEFNPTPPAPTGSSVVQISRTIMAGLYTADAATKLPAPDGAAPPPIERGDSSILAATLEGVHAARKFCMFEQQHFVHAQVLRALLERLDAGVSVVATVPIGPMHPIIDARLTHDKDVAKGTRSRYFDAWDAYLAVARHPRFMLCGLLTADGREDIYVHSKLLLVDDEFVTIGSANLVDLSLDADHSELNASCWDAGVVADLRKQLMAEHMGVAPEAVDAGGGDGDGDVLAPLKALAQRNAAAMLARRPEALVGHVVALDALQYATQRSAPFLRREKI